MEIYSIYRSKYFTSISIHFLFPKASSARCTVGEISEALDKVFGRHKPTLQLVSGAYKSSYGSHNEIDETIEIVKVNIPSY